MITPLLISTPVSVYIDCCCPSASTGPRVRQKLSHAKYWDLELECVAQWTVEHNSRSNKHLTKMEWLCKKYLKHWNETGGNNSVVTPTEVLLCLIHITVISLVLPIMSYQGEPPGRGVWLVSRLPPLPGSPVITSHHRPIVRAQKSQWPLPGYC